MNEELRTLVNSRKYPSSIIAAILFPTHKSPTYALRYALQGKRELKASELNIVQMLAETDNHWTVFIGNKEYIFSKGIYKIVVSIAANTTGVSLYRVYKGTILSKTSSISLGINIADTFKILDNILRTVKENTNESNY